MGNHQPHICRPEMRKVGGDRENVNIGLMFHYMVKMKNAVNA